jgi:hypothetical protein
MPADADHHLPQEWIGREEHIEILMPVRRDHQSVAALVFLFFQFVMNRIVCGRNVALSMCSRIHLCFCESASFISEEIQICNTDSSLTVL